MVRKTSHKRNKMENEEFYEYKEYYEKIVLSAVKEFGIISREAFLNKLCYHHMPDVDRLIINLIKSGDLIKLQFMCEIDSGLIERDFLIAKDFLKTNNFLNCIFHREYCGEATPCCVHSLIKRHAI